jgi:hypothetical protein
MTIRFGFDSVFKCVLLKVFWQLYFHLWSVKIRIQAIFNCFYLGHKRLKVILAPIFLIFKVKFYQKCTTFAPFMIQFFCLNHY